MIAAIVIAVCILATIAAACRLSARHAKSRVIFAHRPDTPRPFGLRMAWIAVRSQDAKEVVAALGLSGLQPANWNTGLGSVYSPELADRCVFVSPPVQGWTFIVGQALPQALGAAFCDKLTPLLLRLGSQFPEVQFYVSYPSLEHFGWSRVIQGRLERAFAVADGVVVWNVGRPTAEERALGLRVLALSGGRGRRGARGAGLLLGPTEHHVLRLAAHWSLDPMRIGKCPAKPGLGVVGRPPSSWRAERYRPAQAA